MKSSRFFAALFVLFFALPVRAETPLVIDSAWCLPNNEWLKTLATADFIKSSDFKRLSFDFPEEIQADAALYGVTFTDGNKVGVVLALPLKDSKQFSLSDWNFLFKIKLRANIVVAAMFSDTAYEMVKRDSMLYLISTGFSEADIDTLELEKYWANLQDRSPMCFLQHYPERTLLPTLPPEQEDDSAFIKKVRARSAGDYKEGQYAGEHVSTFWGLKFFADQSANIVLEKVYFDELPTPPDKDKPFPFGGFIDPDASVSSAFRYPFGKEVFEKITIGIKGGITIIPPEERDEEGKKRKVYLGLWTDSNDEKRKESLQDEWHVHSEEGFILCYPKLTGDRPDEDDLPSNAELDEINEGLVRTILSYVTGVRQPLVSKDWVQPLDVAFVIENDVLFSACSSPTGTPLTKVPNTPGTVTWHRKKWAAKEFLPAILFTDESQTEYSVAAVFGYESDKIYAAFPLTLDEVSEEQYEALQQQLEQKIDASKRAVAEKMEAPKTILSSTGEGMRFRLEQESSERVFRFTGYVEQDSFWNVMALAKLFLR